MGRKIPILILRILCLLCLIVPCLGSFSSARSEHSLSSPEEAVRIGLEACDASIDLTEYKITPRELTALYRSLLENEPLLYHVAGVLTYEYSTDGSVTFLLPQYKFDKDTYISTLSEVDDYLEKALSFMPDTFSDGDKALYIHDYLASTFTYSPEGKENYDIYSMIRDGHGVCQGLSLMYIALGRRAGLEVDMVTSLPMDHAWNHVKIEDSFYHVDVTRDLSATDASFSHERFLLSDRALEQLGYHGYTCHQSHYCKNSTYETADDNGVYQGIIASVAGSSLYLDGSWLSLDQNNRLMLLNLKPDMDAESRLTDKIDLNGDGALTLTDILHPMIQNTPAASSVISNELRKIILEAALSEHTDEKLNP